jgi:membrane-bound serine protease (ClpP class)
VLDWSGNSGHVMAHGERWSAQADRPLVPGTSAIIVGIDGLTVLVRADSDDSAP